MSSPASVLKRTLNDGTAIPVIGLGVFDHKVFGGVASSECFAAVKFALESGYRHIDTASAYGNELAVGEAVRASGLPRSEVWVTTKVWETNKSQAEVEADVQKSLDQLGLEYIDLMLLHSPGPSGEFLGAWRALEVFKARGLLKSIGVSNFGVAHLDVLAANSTSIPSVNQIEIHPYLNRPALVKACTDRGITVEAFCPLVQAKKMDEPTLVAVAAAVGKSPAQVLVRWSVQKGFVVLPKSANPLRIAENSAVFDFELTPEQMTDLDGLGGEKFMASGIVTRFGQLEPY